MARIVRHDTAGKGRVVCDGRGASDAFLRHEPHGARIGGVTAFGFMVWRADSSRRACIAWL